MTDEPELDLATKLDLALSWGEHAAQWLPVAVQLVSGASKTAARAAIAEVERPDLVALNTMSKYAAMNQAQSVRTEWLERRHAQLQHLRAIVAQ